MSSFFLLWIFSSFTRNKITLSEWMLFKVFANFFPQSILQKFHRPSVIHLVCLHHAVRVIMPCQNKYGLNYSIGKCFKVGENADK